MFTRNPYFWIILVFFFLCFALIMKSGGRTFGKPVSLPETRIKIQQKTKVKGAPYGAPSLHL